MHVLNMLILGFTTFVTSLCEEGIIPMHLYNYVLIQQNASVLCTVH